MSAIKSDHRALTIVTAEVPREWTGPLVDSLAAQEAAASSWEDCEGGPSRVTLFASEPADAAPLSALLRRVGLAFGLDLRPETQNLPPQDWAESWKQFFHVTSISPRLVVRPPWEKYEPRHDERVVVIDPGMSFGTGRHATTQACMQMLDLLAEGDHGHGVLDLGCGSGILSIAACKLGFTPVRGLDNDPDAVRHARENALRNGVTAEFEIGDLAAPRWQADIVVANVLAPVLCAHARQVALAVRPSAQHALILSGILDSQYAEVTAAYAAQGFEEYHSILIGEWRSGCFRRITA
ncbi:MAG: 50S ribosomal protein L11 methyltransferase [Kiritimatiellae bacterium]|nr:50S ribosomal protein L11 methyltransferase [Kiritimatiellia bacterium]